jgi:6-pyruvoyl-tetrahydropterin synthase
MDFHQLEAIVDEFITRVHNRHLNEVPPFADAEGQLVVNPTAERVAWWLGEAVSAKLPPAVSLVSVRVGEAPGCTATYRP